MASLTIVVDGVEQRFPLEAATVTLGRGLESDIRLKDIKASRRHCQVVKTSKGYQCVDLSSGNGTYVNGVQIKQQMLGPGDKITIGSTTIAFEEPKAPAPKAPAGKVPAAAPPAPAAVSPRTATAKIATERIQAAPTKKTTARVEAVKSASQGGLKPATQPLGKSGTRLGKPAPRAGTRPRPAPEPPKKKSPVLIIVAIVAVLGLGGGGYYWYSSKDGADPVSTQVRQLMKKADQAEKAEKFDAAVQDYEKALELCQGERYKMLASEITKVLAQLKARKAAPRPDPAPKDPADKGPDVDAKRTEIAGKHKLAGDAADWGGAVKEWNDFLKGKSAADLKTKVEGEIKALHDKAKQDLARLKKKAEALAAENKMAEALDLLKQQQPRFGNTELEAEIAAAIRQYDK